MELYGKDGDIEEKHIGDTTKVIPKKGVYYFKTFYRQIIPELSCARRETVDTGTFILARIAKKFRQPIGTVSRPP